MLSRKLKKEEGGGEGDCICKEYNRKRAVAIHMASLSIVQNFVKVIEAKIGKCCLL